MDIELRKLSAADGRDVYDMLQEMPQNENGFVNAVNGRSFEEYTEWLSRSEENARKTEIEDGWKVPQSVYWLYADGRPVAMGKIRHFLTEKLRREGGHIGYAVRPSERGRGYGTALLGRLLDVCRGMGMDRVLVTVHNDNAASIQAALKNGGIISEITDERHLIWIDC